jgi:hypothetical protein
MGPENCVRSQAATRSMAIAREIQSPVSRRVLTRPVADRAFGLQNACRRRASHVMPGMQEEAAEKIDAGLSAALTG